MTTTERDRLVMLETKVDGIDKKLDKVISDHEERLRCLESQSGRKWNAAMGAIVAAVIVGIVGLVIGAFSDLFK